MLRHAYLHGSHKLLYSIPKHENKSNTSAYFVYTVVSKTTVPDRGELWARYRAGMSVTAAPAPPTHTPEPVT